MVVEKVIIVFVIFEKICLGLRNEWWFLLLLLKEKREALVDD